MEHERKTARKKIDVHSEINILIEDIFRITLSETPPSFNHGVKSLVYMKDISVLFGKQDFDLETLEHALFERLLLKDPERYIIKANTSDTYTDPLVAESHEVFSYLFECYKSALRIKSCGLVGDLEKAIDFTTSLITRNAATALRQPELYSQNFENQILNLVKYSYQCTDDLLSFFVNIAQELEKEDALYDSFDVIFTCIKKVIQSSRLATPPVSCFNILHGFIKVPEIVPAVLTCSQPTPTSNGSLDYENTLLGSLLTMSCIPKDSSSRLSSINSPVEEMSNFSAKWDGMETIHRAVHSIFLSLLKSSPSIRQDTLTWLGQCISYNTGRIKLSNLTPSSLMAPGGEKIYISDGCAINLYCLLLALSVPFTEKRNYSKLYKIDPTYCVPVVETVDQMNSLGIHLSRLNEETCIVPLEEGEIKPVAKEPFNFMTECFFMAHKALEIGLKVCMEKLVSLNQQVGQMEEFNHMFESTSGNTGVRDLMNNTMNTMFMRYMAFRCALVEPNTFLLLGKFMAATIAWVIQILLDDNEHTDESYAPNTPKPLTFPLPEMPPITYKCIPEFIVDNLCSYLIIGNKFNLRTVEQKCSLSLEPLLTGLIVFIGSKNIVRNPHLRARLTEGIECLLPIIGDEDAALKFPGPVENQRRIELFRSHPNRKQLIPALLDIFVGIEMTGEMVQFEQKFNYRRPMYKIIEYLWTVDDHKAVFVELAEKAEKEIEAVSPPIFLRFINILINDAIFLLDEAISNMTELRQLQSRMNNLMNPTTAAEDDDRMSRMERLHHIGMMARFDNILGSKTINTLKLLTEEIKTIFCHPSVVDRVASMLNYFLSHLVGPKQKDLKVKDMAEYNFNPGDLVINICNTYLNLRGSENFCKAVSNDGRSYTPELFQQTENVLVRLHMLDMLHEIRTFSEKVAKLADQQESEDAILCDAPEDYLDPIMSTLMLDPVILPTSNITVDRSVIARHLLSDQSDPFNRMSLTMDMLVPNEALKQEIQNWIKEKISEHKGKRSRRVSNNPQNSQNSENDIAVKDNSLPTDTKD